MGLIVRLLLLFFLSLSSPLVSLLGAPLQIKPESRVHPSPSGTSFVITDEKEARLYRVVPSEADQPVRIQELERIKGGRFLVAYSSDGSHVAVGTPLGFLRVWNLAKGETLTPDSVAPFYLSFLPGTTHLVVASLDGSVILWDNEKKGSVYRFAASRIRSVLPLEGGEVLVLGDEEGGLTLLEAASGRVITGFPAHTRGIVRLALLPEGRLLSLTEEGEMKLWPGTVTGLVKQAQEELRQKAEDYRKRIESLRGREGSPAKKEK